MSSGAEWRKLARAAETAQHRAQRAGSGRGRAQPDRPGMVRIRRTDETAQPPPTSQGKPAMPDSHQGRQPDDELASQLQAEQDARHARADALIAAVEAERPTRDKPISALEWAARHFETGAVHHGR